MLFQIQSNQRLQRSRDHGRQIQTRFHAICHLEVSVMAGAQITRHSFSSLRPIRACSAGSE